MIAPLHAIRIGLAIGVLLLSAAGVHGSEAPAAREPEPPWYFSLLPKPFERDPALECTAITEFTEAGKKLPPVSAQAPAYYQFHSLGFHPMGEAMKESPLAATTVETLLERALTTNGYLRSSSEHPPSVVVVVMWGSHSNFDSTNEAVSDEQLLRNLFDRAALAGGAKFAANLLKAYNDTQLLFEASPVVRSNAPEYEGLGVGIAFGVARMNQAMNPMKEFALRSRKNQQLIDHASEDCYYVVVSAYDYTSVASNQQKLLWRTRLTVGARGVAQKESLPTLINSAAPYLGLEMKEPEIFKKRPLRSGNVEIGAPTVVPSTK